MVGQVIVSPEAHSIVVHVPMTFRMCSGRNTLIAADGAGWPLRPRVNNAMVKALARAFRWRKMLDTGVYTTIERRSLPALQRRAPSSSDGGSTTTSSGHTRRTAVLRQMRFARTPRPAASATPTAPPAGRYRRRQRPAINAKLSQ
jgi:hypothetical protein